MCHATMATNTHPPPATPSVQIQTLQTRHGDELSAAMRANDVEILQTKPAPGAWYLHRVALSGVAVQHGRLGGPALALGAAHPDHVEILIPWPDSAAIHYCGQDMTGRIAMYAPGSSHQARCDASQGFTLLSLDTRALSGRIATLDPDRGPDIPAGGFSHFALPPTKELALRRNILQLVARSREAASDSEPCAAIPALAEAIVGPVLETLLRARGVGQRERPEAPARRATMNRVLEYLAAHRHQPVTVEDLCMAAETGLRSLQYAFQDHFSLPPSRFLRYRRLHQARRLLEGRAAKSVKAAALDSGFWEFGRFSVEYRRLFGESPSSTLQRCLIAHGQGPLRRPRQAAASAIPQEL